MYPRLIQIGSFYLPTYGFLCALGMVLGVAVVFHLSRRQSLDPDKMWNLAGLAVFMGIVGAKILYIIDLWPEYSEHPSEIFSIATFQSGGVFSGGLVLAIACCWWYMHANRIPFLRACDVFAPGLALGHAVGRLGCFSAGCCYGRPTHLPWGVTFTNPLAAQVTGTPLGISLHPTQLYEFAAELVNFFILFRLIKHKRFEGQIIGLYMFLYGIERFVIEFFRGDEGRGSVFSGLLSGTQMISIALVISGGIIWMIRRPLREPVAVPASAH